MSTLALNSSRSRNTSPKGRFTFNAPYALTCICFATLLLFGCQTTKKVSLPKVVGENPTTSELLEAINDNSAKIKSIYATNASIGVQNQPGWANCRFLYERPSKFRLVGTSGLLGRVVDCGCDGEKFWYWNSIQDSDNLYSCKIEEYSQTPLAEVIPVDPTWFPEALGIMEIKEEDLADEPKKQSDGSILLTVNCKRAEGVYKKRVYVESGTAAITRQDVQNPQGETFISILVTEPQLIESAGVVMPKKASIRCLRTGDVLLIDLGTPVLNDSSKIEATVFQLPTDINAKQVDLGEKKQNAAQAKEETAPSQTEADANASASNYTPVRSDELNQNDGAQFALDATAPASSEKEIAENAGIVPFPNALAQNSTQLTAAQPETRIAMTTRQYAPPQLVLPPNGEPEVLPASDSAFAQSLLVRQNGTSLSPDPTENAGSVLNVQGQLAATTPNVAQNDANQGFASNLAAQDSVSAINQNVAQNLATQGGVPAQSQNAAALQNQGLSSNFAAQDQASNTSQNAARNLATQGGASAQNPNATTLQNQGLASNLSAQGQTSTLKPNAASNLAPPAQSAALNQTFTPNTAAQGQSATPYPISPGSVTPPASSDSLLDEWGGVDPEALDAEAEPSVPDDFPDLLDF
ncbi:MAG: hypothetical protein ACI4NP_05075 [Thermoguttaceae bacterium]